MQEIQAAQQVQPPATETRRISGRWIFLAAAALTLLLLGLLPPLIGVNRFQHRISTSISSSLGRPVHFDQVSLNLLPVPSFTISNFVVEEDPSFGAEPIIRANSVRATLRVSSLWRKRIEFSRISFTEPTSLNLVHDSRGRWNIEGILLNAAQIDTAPTAQRDPGATPRFPYIEATGARLNLKEGVEKTPFSLSEADFALWLPDPKAWRMRLHGRPIRTDTSVSDTGSLQVEATLGRAASLQAVPLQIDGSWQAIPLGEASRLMLARDLGLRGEMTLTASIRGTLNQNATQAHLQVTGLRRSDFVPEETVSLDVDCAGTAARVFHSFSDLRCEWPVPDSDGATVALAGAVPDVLDPASADIQIGTSRLPASILLRWLRVASSRMPPGLTASGLLSGSIMHEADAGSTWNGQATMPELRLSSAKLGPAPLVLGNVFIHTPATASADARHPRAPSPTGDPHAVLSPISLPLGGKEPALLEAVADKSGVTLHLTGFVVPGTLAALGAAVPQLGDGLSMVLPSDRPASPVRVDLSARREWTGHLQWTDNLAPLNVAGTRSPRPRSRERR